MPNVDAEITVCFFFICATIQLQKQIFYAYWYLLTSKHTTGFYGITSKKCSFSFFVSTGAADKMGQQNPYLRDEFKNGGIEFYTHSDLRNSSLVIPDHQIILSFYCMQYTI